MLIRDIINETTSSGGIATFVQPMTKKIIKRASPIAKKGKIEIGKGIYESNPRREKAVDILVSLVQEKGLESFSDNDEIESFMARNMPEFYQGRDTGKAIEDAMSKLDLI